MSSIFLTAVGENKCIKLKWQICNYTHNIIRTFHWFLLFLYRLNFNANFFLHFYTLRIYLECLLSYFPHRDCWLLPQMLISGFTIRGHLVHTIQAKLGHTLSNAFRRCQIFYRALHFDLINLLKSFCIYEVRKLRLTWPLN